jgi:hypothetical protein
MNMRQSQGLCFSCDKKFSSGHRWKQLFALYIVPDSDDEQVDKPD